MAIRDFIAGVLLLLLGCIVVVGAQGFENVNDSPYGPGLFPTLIGSSLIIGGGMLALRSSRAAKQAWEETPRSPALLSLRKILWKSLPVWLVLLYVFAAERLGALVLLCVVLFVMLMASGVRLRTAIPLTLIAASLVWYVFSRMLGVALPVGPLGI